MSKQPDYRERTKEESGLKKGFNVIDHLFNTHILVNVIFGSYGEGKIEACCASLAFKTAIVHN
jgi:hypothetical protein